MITEKEELNEETLQNDAAELNETADLNAQIEQLQADVKEAKSKYLYLYSDLESIKRNAAKERIETISTAGRDIMSALLPILDDFDRAAKASPLNEGIELIKSKLESTLQQKGLRSMELSAGDPFDADAHEAVAEIPVPDESAKGLIVDVLEQGYTLGGKIIRFARVVVGR
jgi:molecular chaperone GrpE